MKQIKDEEWGGEFVDLLDQQIPHRSHIRAIYQGPEPHMMTTAANTSHLNTPKQLFAVQSPLPTSVQLKLVPAGGLMSLAVTPEQGLDIVNDKLSEITRLATIYSKESSRPLSNYQIEMNKAAITLCLNNPQLLLKKRSELIAKARQKIIDEGFQFKKGRSRSKKDNVKPIEPKTKRQKTTHVFREKRLLEIEEKVDDIADRITFKEKRITECIGISDYEKCDYLKKEIMSLKQDRRELLAEKEKLIISNRKAAWYKRKKSSTDTDSSDATFEPVTEQSEQDPFSPSNTSNHEPLTPSEIYNSPVSSNNLQPHVPLPSDVGVFPSSLLHSPSTSGVRNGIEHF
jgi:hypothetical protein